MKIAHIAPTPLLYTSLFESLDYHLCIASQVLKDPEYATFFRGAKGFVILDVPTREEKDSTGAYPIERLKRAITSVQPNEVVLPDVWKGSPQVNIEAAWRAAFELREANTRRGLGFIAVPRGKDFKEYVNCAEEMALIPGVTTLGVFTGTYETYKVERERVVLEFSRRFPQHAIHLLGVVNDLSDIQNPVIRKHVRGTDTAKLVRFGLDCKHPMFGNIPEYPGRGEDYFQRGATEIQLSYVAKNIRYWNSICAEGKL